MLPVKMKAIFGRRSFGDIFRMRVRWDLQLASELIVEQVEIGQIDEAAELLGQFSCKKSEMSANTQRMYVGTYKSHRRDHMRPS